jgi:hypothetical protein
MMRMAPRTWRIFSSGFASSATNASEKTRRELVSWKRKFSKVVESVKRAALVSYAFVSSAKIHMVDTVTRTSALHLPHKRFSSQFIHLVCTSTSRLAHAKIHSH